MKIAILADIHEDLKSLKSALGIIEKQNCDEIFCLGDISGFSVPHYSYFEERNASLCLDLLRKNCKIIVPGNHDLHAIRKTPDISPKFTYPSNWYELDYYMRKELAEDMLWLYDNDELDPLYTNDDKDYMKGLKEFYLFEHGTNKLFLSHFVYPNLTGNLKEFYFSKHEFIRHLDFAESFGAEISFTGHMHYPGLMVVNDKKILTKKFRKIDLPKGRCVVVAPAIARANNKNGFLVLDIENSTIEAIRL